MTTYPIAIDTHTYHSDLKVIIHLHVSVGICSAVKNT